MLERANVSWNARQLSKAIENGEAVFDSAVQRRLVWNDEKNSLLVHSMIEGYPIPAMYSANEKGKKSFIDGKQRSNAIYNFLNDKFALKNIPVITLKDGTDLDLNGKKFSELPEDIRDIISNYSLTIFYYENITDDEICELFFRLNNGVSPSAIERSRTRCKSLSTIQQLGNHELFTTALTAKAFEKYTHEDLVIKSFIMLTFKNPCYDNKVVRPTLETAEFTQEIIDQLNMIFDRIIEVYKLLIADDSTSTGKMSKKIAKRVITRTHMLSIIPIVKRSIDENVSVETFTSWIKNFYCGKKSPTNYDQYNSNASSGSGHLESIKARLSAINKDYNKFMKKLGKVVVEDNVEDITAETDTENVEVTENTSETVATETEEVEVIESEEVNADKDTTYVESVVVESADDFDVEPIDDSDDKEPTAEELAEIEKEFAEITAREREFLGITDEDIESYNSENEYAPTGYDDLLDNIVEDKLF